MTISDGAGSAERSTRTVTLSEGANTIAVSVTAEDGVTERVYTVTVTRAAAPSADATLSALSLSDVDIGAFSAATHELLGDGGARGVGDDGDGDALGRERDR